jgi:hypothetical protein
VKWLPDLLMMRLRFSITQRVSSHENKNNRIYLIHGMDECFYRQQDSEDFLTAEVRNVLVKHWLRTLVESS